MSRNYRVNRPSFPVKKKLGRQDRQRALIRVICQHFDWRSDITILSDDELANAERLLGLRRPESGEAHSSYRGRILRCVVRLIELKKVPKLPTALLKQISGMFSRQQTLLLKTTDKPLASKPFISYRYHGPYGPIMIGAVNDMDALRQAQRSLTGTFPVLTRLDRWDAREGKYKPVRVMRSPITRVRKK